MGSAMTQGSRAVLAMLSYKTVDLQDSKIISVPDIVLGTDSELCSKRGFIGFRV